MLTISDRVFIALLLTLAMFVLVLEWRKRGDVMPQLKPARITDWNLRDTNVPHHRTRAVPVDDVAYIDVSDASQAGSE